MHNLLPLEEVEEVFAAGLHPEQRRLALRPSDGLRVESALRRRDPQRLAAEVLLTADLGMRSATDALSWGRDVRYGAVPKSASSASAAVVANSASRAAFHCLGSSSATSFIG